MYKSGWSGGWSVGVRWSDVGGGWSGRWGLGWSDWSGWSGRWSVKSLRNRLYYLANHFIFNDLI
jgi:hypothetical protein